MASFGRFFFFCKTNSFLLFYCEHGLVVVKNNVFIICRQTNTMLKSTCSMLENQVEELEIINEDYEEKQLQWNITR